MEPKLVALRAIHLRVLEKISHSRPFFELNEGELDDATPTENGSSVQTTVPTHPTGMDSYRTFNALLAPTPPTQSTQADPRNGEPTLKKKHEDPARVRVLQDLRGRVTHVRADWNTEVREANNSRENERFSEPFAKF
uniref:Uncharacterized protein n=1 Tax=Caenorhabditis japonica TaxID=281687 RepID=A0A8R1ETJ9_CAEJA